MNAERLVVMANDIANFFAAEPERQIAIDGIATHLKKFWEPRMRKQLAAHVQAHGAAGLNELAAAALARLETVESRT